MVVLSRPLSISNGSGYLQLLNLDRYQLDNIRISLSFSSTDVGECYFCLRTDPSDSAIDYLNNNALYIEKHRFGVGGQELISKTIPFNKILKKDLYASAIASANASVDAYIQCNYDEI
jgi:hypothetical protein